jgi:hypothetical protein
MGVFMSIKKSSLLILSFLFIIVQNGTSLPEGIYEIRYQYVISTYEDSSHLSDMKKYRGTNDEVYDFESIKNAVIMTEGGYIDGTVRVLRVKSIRHHQCVQKVASCRLA